MSSKSSRGMHWSMPEELHLIFMIDNTNFSIDFKVSRLQIDWEEESAGSAGHVTEYGEANSLAGHDLQYTIWTD